MRQSIFVHQHRLDPAFTIGGNEVDNSTELLAFETFAFENLLDLFALTLGSQVDMTIFDLLQSSPIVMFRF